MIQSISSAVLIVVIISPMPLTEERIPPESKEGWGTLKRFAATHQLVGPQEKWYGWESEVRYVRQQYHVLRGCPPIEDLSRLPDLAYAEERADKLSEGGRILWRQLEGAYSWERDTYHASLGAVEREEKFWRAVITARQTQSWSTARQKLNEIRSMVGSERYCDAVITIGPAK